MSEWISVEDRLPDKWVCVLVWNGDKVCEAEREYSYEGEYSGKEVIRWLSAGEWPVDNVTHWMSMPTPPKDEDE